MSSTFTPEPSAMRRLRLELSTEGVSRSYGVMDWMMAAVRAMAFSSTCAPLSAPAFMPGIMAAISSSEPIFFSCES